MLLRKIKFSASILGLGLSAALALAQDPPANSAVESAYPQNNAVDFAPQAGTPDDWNLGWQWRFQADALYMKRNNHSSDIPVISGAEPFRFQDLNFDFEPGTRLTLSLMEEDYEFEVSFMQLSDWRASGSRTLINATVFDGPDVYAASPLAQPIVNGPDLPNFVTPGTYFAPINAAANAAAEANELEFLTTGATLSARYTSSLQDVEANYKQR